jgi:hypothetical protein
VGVMKLGDQKQIPPFKGLHHHIFKGFDIVVDGRRSPAIGFALLFILFDFKRVNR